MNSFDGLSLAYINSDWRAVKYGLPLRILVENHYYVIYYRH